MARVWLSWDTVEELQGLGNWSYLIKGTEGVVIFDTGFKYSLISTLSFVLGQLDFRDFRDLLTGIFTGKLDLQALLKKVSLQERCRDPSLSPMPTAPTILAAVKERFPDQRIREIVLSHWHVDHIEDAPRLQQLAFTEWGFRPPLRIGPEDRARLDTEGSLGDAEQVFREACFPPGSWTWGEDLADGAVLTGTTYRAIWLPGHTLGSYSLVSEQEGVGIREGADFIFDPNRPPLLSLLMGPMKIVNEDHSNLRASGRKFKEMVDDKNYVICYSHFQYTPPQELGKGEKQ